MSLFPLCLSCKCPLLGKVWEADLEACRLLIQSLQLQEARGSLSVEDERQMDALKGAVCIAAPPIPPRLHSEDKRKNPLQALEEWKAHLIPSLYCAGGEQKEVCPFHMVSRGDPYSKGCFGTMLQMGTIYIGRASH